MPNTVVPFALPRKPKVREKDAPPDQRTVCIMPIRALTDPKLTDGSVRVLALLCSYCNRAGITWVSQKRLSEDMKITRQGITNQLAKLREAGYVEILRKGFRGDHCNTLRVIFDPNLKAEDAISITSSIEDTRPPAIRAEQERQASEQIDREGQAKIAKLISQALKQTTNQKEYAMPVKGETRAVREVKEAMARTRAKQSKAVDKTVDNQQSIGHPTVSNEAVSKVSYEGLHRQSIGHCAVSRNSEELSKDSIKVTVFKESLKDRVIGHQEIEMLIENGLTIEQIAENLDILLPLYRAEGIEPSSSVLAIGIRQLWLDVR